MRNCFCLCVCADRLFGEYISGPDSKVHIAKRNGGEIELSAEEQKRVRRAAGAD